MVTRTLRRDDKKANKEEKVLGRLKKPEKKEKDVRNAHVKPAARRVKGTRRTLKLKKKQARKATMVPDQSKPLAPRRYGAY
jgi:hypothetical protein